MKKNEMFYIMDSIIKVEYTIFYWGAEICSFFYSSYEDFMKLESIHVDIFEKQSIYSVGSNVNLKGQMEKFFFWNSIYYYLKTMDTGCLIEKN